MGAIVMKLRFRDDVVPYPIFAIKGRLRLSGLGDKAISEVMGDPLFDEIETEDALLNFVHKSLDLYQPLIRTNFEVLTRYENLRGESSELPAIVVVLEGASATGKSLIALELMHDLTATRFISTDSVRQVLRSILNEKEYPELFCHTYQAYTHRQSGPSDLNPVVRGFLAQCQIITPHIEAMTKRVISEGAIAVIEGVHIHPGVLQKLSQGVIEVLVNPEIETHRAMFASKHDIGKLKTVTDDKTVRSKEFEATRTIQDYMISQADKAGVPIVSLTSYEDVRTTISKLIIARVRNLLDSFEEGGETQ
jgi:2-phosphoglycerate kinase